MMPIDALVQVEVPRDAILWWSAALGGLAGTAALEVVDSSIIDRRTLDVLNERNFAPDRGKLGRDEGPVLGP
jgi:hypothetical protein